MLITVFTFYTDNKITVIRSPDDGQILTSYAIFEISWKILAYLAIMPGEFVFEGLKSSSFYECTIAIAVANLTVQVYRLLNHITSFIADGFKVNYSADISWPLNPNDIKPYVPLLFIQDETIYRLAEKIILILTAFFGITSILNYSFVWTIVYTAVFSIHSFLSIAGAIMIKGKHPKNPQ